MINSRVRLLTSSAWTLPDLMSERRVWNRIALVLYEFCELGIDGRDWRLLGKAERRSAKIAGRV
jgi:hypothetical protein